MEHKTGTKGKTPVKTGVGAYGADNYDVVRTDEIIKRGKPFSILKDMGVGEGEYGEFHSLIIKQDGFEPEVWNTGAKSVLDILQWYETPIDVLKVYYIPIGDKYQKLHLRLDADQKVKEKVKE